ncbi:MAG: DUF5686 family protein [Saprospiraceae bacterium]|nr:DUF5686 family protein [Saprospiraceae bacterium]
MFSRIILFFAVVLFACNLSAQKVTKIRGKVFDAQTGEALPFVDVGLKGTNVGVSTDLDGNYNIETRFPSDTVFASFLGYETQYFPITKFKTNKITFRLKDQSLKIETVEIREKKTKYVKENNPAIDLAQKVISNKYTNSLKGKDYYKYDQQEKINIDINNITEGFKNTRFIRKFDFMWDYIDTSEINGKTYLPFFMRENLSTIHYKRAGNTLKEVRKASKYTNIEESLDAGTINDALDALYQDIDIYEEKIDLLDQQFVSPFARAGYDFYRYYIIDTTVVNDKEAINLAFIPAVKGNFGFLGNIFVSNDGKFTVLKVDMGIVQGINLNFVRDLRIVQEFEPLGDDYIKIKDELIIDYALTENSWGLYGTRTLFFSNYDFSKPEDESIFGELEKVLYEDQALEQPETYWQDNRIRPLEKNDVELYQMVDSLSNNPYYKRYSYISKMIITGFASMGPVSAGPLATFVSFNDVEGLNLRFGMETNKLFSKKIQAQGYLARAFKTDLWKYSGALIYTFNDNYIDNPRNYLKFTVEKESSFPGQELEFFNPSNFFLSFQRGDATKMLLDKTYELTYVKEYNGFSYHLDVRRKERLPYGSLEFYSFDQEGNRLNLNNITTAEATIGFRYAPNEQFLQGRVKRTQLPNQYPIFTVNYTHGHDGILGGQYTYDKIRLNIFKQIEWLQIGTTNMVFDAGKTWGDVPYILQEIPRGNQTYAYQLTSYNMMNFMEFVSDQFVSFNAEHYFSGYFMNRIPLIKKLKLREIMTFKAFYGSLADSHNPNLDPTLLQFPLDADGNPSTFAMGKEPYMEFSLGFSNILKILRFDVVQRLNYLDQPNVPALFGNKGLGIRVRTLVEF